MRGLQKAGLKVGLGTDVAGGYSPSMLDAIRQAITASKMVSINGSRFSPYHHHSVLTPIFGTPCSIIGVHSKLRLSVLTASFVLTSIIGGPEPLTLFDGLYLATLGGATALGMEQGTPATFPLSLTRRSVLFAS